MRRSTAGLLTVLSFVVLGGGALLTINSVNADTQKVTNGVAKSIKMSNGNACYCANASDPYGKTTPCLQVDVKSGKEIKNAMGCSCAKSTKKLSILGRNVAQSAITCSANTEEGQKTILVGKVTKGFKKIAKGSKGPYYNFYISVPDTTSKTGKSEISVQSYESSNVATYLSKGQPSNMESYMSNLVGTTKTIDEKKITSTLVVGDEVMVSGTMYYTNKNGKKTINYMVADVVKFAGSSSIDSAQVIETVVPQESQTATNIVEEATVTPAQAETSAVVGQ